MSNENSTHSTDLVALTAGEMRTLQGSFLTISKTWADAFDVVGRIIAARVAERNESWAKVQEKHLAHLEIWQKQSTDNASRFIRAERLLELVDAFAESWKPEINCHCEACLFVIAYCEQRFDDQPIRDGGGNA